MSKNLAKTMTKNYRELTEQLKSFSRKYRGVVIAVDSSDTGFSLAVAQVPVDCDVSGGDLADWISDSSSSVSYIECREIESKTP